MPTLTTLISTFDCPAASSTACLMLFTVFWILATTPRLTPDDSALPTPRTSILFAPARRPTVTHIFVVPMSSPTTIGESLSDDNVAFITLLYIDAITFYNASIVLVFAG